MRENRRSSSAGVLKNWFGQRRRRGFSESTPLQAECLEFRTLLAAQSVASDAPVKTVAVGETVDIPVIYETLNDNGSPAAIATDRINFNLHFDSDVIEFVSVSGVFQEDISISPDAARPETDSAVTGDDGDPSTDSVLLASYVDTNAGWPDSPTSSGIVLYTARFRILNGFVETDINFSANQAGSEVGGSGAALTFASSPITLQSPSGPTLSVGNPAAVDEGQNVSFIVSLTGSPTSAVTVEYNTESGDGPSGAIGGEDFVEVPAAAPLTLTFNPGETTKTVTVQTIDDFLVEGDKNFSLVLNQPAGATIRQRRATATILDDDAGLPALNINNPQAVVEGQDAVFTVSLSAASASTVTVGYATQDGNGPPGATAGNDYDAKTGTLTFAPGETSKTITITTIDDSISESLEDFGVLLSDPTNARVGSSFGEVQLSDNDSGLPTLRILEPTAVTEGGISEFTVTLSEAATEPVTVEFSTSDGGGPTDAMSGSDFVGQLNVALTFAAGETSKVIQVVTLDDAAVETLEQFEVTLDNSVGASIAIPTAVGTILDNDEADGDVDDDDDFDANDSFLIHLVKLSGTNSQVDQSKGSSQLTAPQIRVNINALETLGDVDGDSDFDANDSFLIHLVKLSGTDGQIDQSKGSSQLSAAEIRSRIDALDPPGQQSSGSGGSASSSESAFAFPAITSDKGKVGQSVDDQPSYAVDETWEDYRGWLSAL